VVRDWKGNVCEIGAEFDVTYLRTAIDFVTRRWIKCPVESRADWKDMAVRYDPAEPARFAADARERAGRLRFRDWPVTVSVNGPFWQLREWLGFENLCTMFYDDPAFLREMAGFWEDFVARLLSRLFDLFVPDEVHLSEDMAFKGYSMISPAMAREFLLPSYRRWGKLLREAGVRVYAMDSDGFIGELIPIWIEAGINVCDPIEAAAGNDIAGFRARFGRSMGFRGGVDKRLIAKGGTAIEGEIARLLPIVRDGGFIPSCDHGVPPDIAWPDFVRYTGLLAKATGWL
jgi:uroporphyrinogen decarboxylase